MFGIDISHWDNDSRKPVDYGEILKSCDFVIIKAKDGKNTDPKLMTNYNALQSLKTGFYCYSYATTIEEAKAEARAFCELLKPMKRDAGLWLDVEDKRQKAHYCRHHDLHRQNPPAFVFNYIHKWTPEWLKHPWKI
jgi:GH25 family lysozyme M1 (1,4-beta-N-acetylmuramidase)